MDLEKRYKTGDNKPCNILQLVKAEPEWASNIIQRYEKSTADLVDVLIDEWVATEMFLSCQADVIDIDWYNSFLKRMYIIEQIVQKVTGKTINELLKRKKKEDVV